MSDTTATEAGVGVAGVVSGLGLAPLPEVADAAALANVGGPFLTANVIAADGTVIGCVAVIDGPDGGDETLLDRLASVAALESGGSVSTAEPVAGGAGIAERFSVPIQVEVFGDGQTATVVSVSSADRRGDTPAAAAATPAAPVGGFAGPPSGGGLEKLVNVSLNVSVELGRTRVSLAEVLDYDVGSVVELDRAAGAPVDVRVNDTLLAQGEVVLIDDEYAVRITAIYDPNNPHR